MSTIKPSVCAIMSLITMSVVASAAPRSLSIMSDSVDQRIDRINPVSVVAISFDSVFLATETSSSSMGWLSDSDDDATIDLDLRFTPLGTQSCTGNPVMSSLTDLVRAGDLPDPVSTMPMTLSLRFDQ